MATRTHTSRTLLALGGALLALTAASGCSNASDDKDPESRSFALPGKRLKVVARDGDLDIRPADVDEVQVTRWFSGYTVLGGDPEVTWSMDDGTLRLTADCGTALVSDCDVRHKVLVPRDAAVTVNADNGAVKASGFSSDLEIDADNGSVRVKDASGTLTLSSDNGKVVGEGLSSRRVSAESDNGEVKLSFDKVPDNVRADSDNGRITMVLPEAEYRVEAEASNGDVGIGVPDDPRSKHLIHAGSDNGEISLRMAE